MTHHPVSAAAQSATTMAPRAPHQGPVAAAAPTHIYVVGTPAPQGSHRAFVVKGRAIVTQDSKKTKPWREAVKAAAHDPQRTPLVGPVEVSIVFYMPRPQAHYRSGKHAGELKATAPDWCDKRPDIDKCTRSTCDALTEAGVYRDDNQVVRLSVQQRYANHTAGARIVVTALTDSVSVAVPHAPSLACTTDTDPTSRHPHTGEQGEGTPANGCRDTQTTAGGLW